MSIELAKAALEGFNITYRDLNEQQQQEVDKRIALESSIAIEDADLEKQKLAFIVKEKALQQMQHAFNEMLDKVRGKENEKNLNIQRLQYLNERRANLDEFLKKAAGQLSGIEESINFTGSHITEEQVKIDALENSLKELKEKLKRKENIMMKNG